MNDELKGYPMTAVYGHMSLYLSKLVMLLRADGKWRKAAQDKAPGE
jgi:hypothetical protein